MENKALTCGQIARRKMWIERISDCKQSGLTVGQWCENNGIREKTYWRWHKIIKDQYVQQNTEPEISEIYEIQDTDISQVVNTSAIATIKASGISAEIYTENPEVIAVICKAMKQC